MIRPVIEFCSTGFKDLWGYGITLLGLRGHANHQSCYQINSKSSSGVSLVLQFLIVFIVLHSTYNSTHVAMCYNAY